MVFAIRAEELGQETPIFNDVVANTSYASVNILDFA